MQNNVWKEFEANPLSHSAAHYLMTIKTLLNDRGYARVTDVARELNITRGSCSISLKPLKQRGLVTVDENKFLKLSDEGLRLAEIVEQNDEVLKQFFAEVLGVDHEQAEIDACKIEHLLSIETSMKLASFLHFVRSDREVCKEFLNSLQKHAPKCMKDTDTCNICETRCLASREV